mmetsp:Transcript_33794/g.50113  ORF Transcript_33794/g.50113 Transcript_33794/m.50113 type:complete len:590 (-) Transcript_33794:128-1897(-)|eukprot:CAMPEP_0194049216 /NCGR_PEP_ID=MMETSP0009_2-20130614/30026_1 /TAXON_ID=210454 /ORGANISM="Grammatophora oceanica, Strain CCMP 410" /LENGTH=589 /DNA_ID=CAMNT_0038695315 /DNA_START=102 /DNA_END=1871 /DNA_ORIENTATION=+
MVEAGGSSWHQTNRGVSIYFAIYLALFTVVILLSKGLHESPKLASIMPEAAMVILVGMVAGWIFFMFANVDYDVAQGDDDGVVVDVAETLLSFSPTIFFVVLLPPIIFNSGYHIQRDLFLRHIIPICLYACAGTALASCVTASLLYISRFLFASADFDPSFLELLTFGALISATDPVSTLAVFQVKKVDPQLFYLVFGESVINDAVGLVLFEALAHLVEQHYGQEETPDIGAEVSQFLFDFALGFVGSMLLGMFTGVCTGLVFKYLDMRSTPLLELCLYLPILYVPFVLAEIAHLSGIVAVLFGGIAARRYAEPNLSDATAQNAITIFRLVAHLTETIIFLELGLSVFGLMNMRTNHFHGGFIALTLIACFISRASNIYPMTTIYNWCLSGPQRLARSSPKNSDNKVLDGNDSPTISLSSSSSEEKIDDRKIPWNTAHMLWFSGLRGAVSYALVKTFPENTGHQVSFVVTTMFIVLITTFVLGGSTEAALKCMNIPMGIDENKYVKSLTKRSFVFSRAQRFEAFTLRRWIIRDFEKEHWTPANLVPEDIETHEGYQEHVEMTEAEHRKQVEKFEAARIAIRVYDIGNKL